METSPIGVTFHKVAWKESLTYRLPSGPHARSLGKAGSSRCVGLQGAVASRQGARSGKEARRSNVQSSPVCVQRTRPSCVERAYRRPCGSVVRPVIPCGRVVSSPSRSRVSSSAPESRSQTKTALGCRKLLAGSGSPLAPRAVPEKTRPAWKATPSMCTMPGAVAKTRASPNGRAGASTTSWSSGAAAPSPEGPAPAHPASATMASVIAQDPRMRCLGRGGHMKLSPR